MVYVKLAKNPEIKRIIAVFFMLFIMFLVLAACFAFIGAERLERAAARSHAAVVGAVADKYPGAERETVRQIISSPDKDMVSKGQAILSRYGFPAEGTLLDTGLFHDYLRTNIALYAAIAILACGSPALLFFSFIKKQYLTVNNIAEYARRIEKGDYSLDIKDNSEGDISILKNEICKITTMLKEQAETLRRDKRILSESLADISHQLKTPMTSLFVLNDLLYGDLSREVRAEFLDRIWEQLRRLEWLVSSLLKLSRLDAETVVMSNEKVHVGTLIERVLEAIAIPLEIKELDVCVKGENDAVFTGDFNWTIEALINILKNCMEHTPERGCINVSFEENPVYTEISVSDNGDGIDREDIPKIFNRFYRGKNASADSTGIGLAMSKAIIEKQGGDITAQSEKGKGTRFIIKFYKVIV